MAAKATVRARMQSCSLTGANSAVSFPAPANKNSFRRKKSNAWPPCIASSNANALPTPCPVFAPWLRSTKSVTSTTLVPTSGLDELEVSRVQMPQELQLLEGDTVIIRSNGNGDLVGRCLFVRELARPTT